jgi:hypothetical protein
MQSINSNYIKSTMVKKACTTTFLYVLNIMARSCNISWPTMRNCSRKFGLSLLANGIQVGPDITSLGDDNETNETKIKSDLYLRIARVHDSCQPNTNLSIDYQLSSRPNR